MDYIWSFKESLFVGLCGACGSAPMDSLENNNKIMADRLVLFKFIEQSYICLYTVVIYYLHIIVILPCFSYISLV
jgi:hypothetical protein